MLNMMVSVISSIFSIQGYLIKNLYFQAKCLSMDGDVANKCYLSNFSNMETAKICMNNNIHYFSSKNRASIYENFVKILYYN